MPIYKKILLISALLSLPLLALVFKFVKLPAYYHRQPDALVNIPLLNASSDTPSPSVIPNNFFAQESAFIMSAQKASGALGLTPEPSSQIIPYYDNLALWSLVKNDLADGPKVKKYLEWYLQHVNYTADNIGVVGTIYDYDMVDGREIPTYVHDPNQPDYDSSDSYAATYLSLVYEYYKKFGDTDLIRSNLDKLKIIAGAIDATLQDNGLTLAKADDSASYLMDNVEVWRGYSDFSRLLTALGAGDAQKYSEKANGVSKAIETLLWDEERKEYKWYFGAGQNDWSVFYPDAMANLWPIIFELPHSSDKTKILYEKFIAAQAKWPSLDGFDSPDTSIAVAAALAGDNVTLNKYFSTVESKYGARQWPWAVNESGWYIMAKRLTDQIQ